MNTIHELATQGKSIREIARILGIARNTVRRYLRGKTEAIPRPKRGSKLDPYKGQVRKWSSDRARGKNCANSSASERSCGRNATS